MRNGAGIALLSAANTQGSNITFRDDGRDIKVQFNGRELRLNLMYDPEAVNPKFIVTTIRYKGSALMDADDVIRQIPLWAGIEIDSEEHGKHLRMPYGSNVP